MTNLKFEFMAIKFNNQQLEILDQTLIPQQEKWLRMTGIDEVSEAIVQLRVRGAPLIGVAAAAFLVARCQEEATTEEIADEIAQLKKTRPTAVNLFNGLKLIESGLSAGGVVGAKNAAINHIENEINIHKKIIKIGAHQIQNLSLIHI